eukprot:evm.model.scf_2056.2 EVM.evm.TU.scf_2056.2   scf_2056:6921-8444(+)
MLPSLTPAVPPLELNKLQHLSPEDRYAVATTSRLRYAASSTQSTDVSQKAFVQSARRVLGTALSARCMEITENSRYWSGIHAAVTDNSGILPGRIRRWGRNAMLSRADMNSKLELVTSFQKLPVLSEAIRMIYS